MQIKGEVSVGCAMGQPGTMNAINTDTGKAKKTSRPNGIGYRAKELAEIRNSLRPFEQQEQQQLHRQQEQQQLHRQQEQQQLHRQQEQQQLHRQQEQQQQPLRTVSSLSTASSTNSVCSDGTIAVQDLIQKLTLMGYDEASAVRAVSLGAGRETTALDILHRQYEDTVNRQHKVNGLARNEATGLTAGVVRKPSMEYREGYHRASPAVEMNNRPDSPALGAPALPPRSSHQDPPRLPAQGDMTNNHTPVNRQYSPNMPQAVSIHSGEPPPPPPPRGAHNPPPTPPRGTTPPPPVPPHNAAPAMNGNLPPLLLKRMSPVPVVPSRSQGVAAVTQSQPGRGTSPVSRINNQPIVINNSLEVQQQVAHQMQALSLYPGDLNGQVEPPPPYPMGSAAVSNPPPSYSQTLAMRQSPTLSSTSSDYRRSPAPHSLHYPHMTGLVNGSSATSPIPACPSPVSSILSGSSRSSSMQAWSARQAKTHSPIIMQSVKSTQVQKPVLQTACAPTTPVDGGSPTGFPPIARGAIAVTTVTAGVVTGVATGVVTGVATTVPTAAPPPPSYAASIQQKQSLSQPTPPISPSPLSNPSPVPSLVSCPTPPIPTANPPSYNASIQAKHAAIHRALSPQGTPDLPPPPPYPSTAVSKAPDEGLVSATPALARSSPVINTAKVVSNNANLVRTIECKPPLQRKYSPLMSEASSTSRSDSPVSATSLASDCPTVSASPVSFMSSATLSSNQSEATQDSGVSFPQEPPPPVPPCNQMDMPPPPPPYNTTHHTSPVPERKNFSKEKEEARSLPKDYFKSSQINKQSQLKKAIIPDKDLSDERMSCKSSGKSFPMSSRSASGKVLMFSGSVLTSSRSPGSSKGAEISLKTSCQPKVKKSSGNNNVKQLKPFRSSTKKITALQKSVQKSKPSSCEPSTSHSGGELSTSHPDGEPHTSRPDDEPSTDQLDLHVNGIRRENSGENNNDDELLILDDQEDESTNPTNSENGKVQKKTSSHDDLWINRLVSKYKSDLERIDKGEGIVVLRCIKCHAYYKQTNPKVKKYHWAHGLEDCRTWERFLDHLQSQTHQLATRFSKRVSREENVILKQLQDAAKKKISKFDSKMIEDKLQASNVLRNLFMSIKARQSTRSLYSRLDCFDVYLKDLFEAVTAKRNLAEELVEAQPTEYRKEQLEDFQKLEEAMPTLFKITGESQSDGFKNRTTKIKNMKLKLGETIYENILFKVLNGLLHTFASDGVEDIRIRHSLNIFFQSETQELGLTINYFGRIEYAKVAMNHEGETDLILSLINHCLPGFAGYMFGGVLDGPNVHFGEKNSVSTLLKIQLTRDFSHCSALAITHETKAIPEIFEVKQVLADIGNDLKNSYQKEMEFRGVFEYLEEAIQEFEICPPTRWCFIRKAGIKMINVLLELVLFYENRCERQLNGLPEDPTALGRLKQLKCLKFLAALHVTMDTLEPVNALNKRTQGRKGLISEKRHNVDITLQRLEALKKIAGPYEKKLLEQVDFSEEHPKLVFPKGEIVLRKLHGHIIRMTRTVGEDTIRSRSALVAYIEQFKLRANSRMQSEIRECMSKDSLAHAFGVFDILSMPIVVEDRDDCWGNLDGQADLKKLSDHFGNPFWVLRSFKDNTSENGFMVKPVLQDPVLDKDAVLLEFVPARSEIVRCYRSAVVRGDTLTKQFGKLDCDEDEEDDYEDGETASEESFTQRDAYEEFVGRSQDDYPNVCVLLRHLLAHIPNSVDCERNASNLKLTLTKQRNRMLYDTLNAEMQVTENGPKPFTIENEELISTVADALLKGGYSSASFKPNLKFMKDVS